MVLILFTDPILSLVISIIAIVIESLLFVMLLVGWYFGARRLNLSLHHWMVYSLIPIHSVFLFLWMIPRFLVVLTTLPVTPIGGIGMIFHGIFGILAGVVIILIVILFLLRRDLPLNLLRKTRPLMFVALLMWVILFIGGTSLTILTRLTI